MKTLNKAILALAASSILAVSANAAVSYGANGVGQPYIGTKVGKLSVDLNNTKTNDATAYGVYGGYNFDRNFGVEAEYLGSSKADVTHNTTGLKGEYDAKTYGVYGTYRYHLDNTPLYAKAKLGLAKTEAEAKFVGGSVKTDQTSLAGGVGVGFQATPNFGIEAGYNYLNSDANLWGVGAHLSF